MKTNRCGECHFLRADEDGHTACFESPPVADPDEPRYRWGSGMVEVHISRPLYPAVSTITPACGKFMPKAV